jgi:hypothetical protein
LYSKSETRGQSRAQRAPATRRKKRALDTRGQETRGQTGVSTRRKKRALGHTGLSPWVGLAAVWVLWAALAFAQVAILQIRVIEGEGAVHLPGSRSTRPITVEITDETGKPVAGAAVSFHLPEDGPSGAFVNGLRTEVVTTDAHGRASLHGFLANRLAGRFQIRILASKEQARAGTVSFQYVAESRGGAAKVAAAPSSRRKWIVVAAAVAGGAVAGIVALRGGAASPAAAPAAPVPPALSIGSPSITVGKP